MQYDYDVYEYCPECGEPIEGPWPCDCGYDPEECFFEDDGYDYDIPNGVGYDYDPYYE